MLEAGEVGGITQPAGLKGFGGIGKTELALAYAKANKGTRYEEGYFMVADSLAAFDQGLARIAEPELPADAVQETIQALKSAALQKLGKSQKALVIFDNVDEIVRTPEFQAVLAAIPKAHILLTCRHSDMGDRVKQLAVEKMDEGVGALYVLRLGLGQEENGPWQWEEFSTVNQLNARLLAKELDGLPLALHHAGSAIRAGESPLEVLEDYRGNRARILGNRGSAATATHPLSAELTVIRAFEKLLRKDPSAAELVLCCAYLPADAISEDLFTERIVLVSEPLKSDKRPFSRIRSAALNSALIEREPNKGRLNMHRVTQAILQDSSFVDGEARLTDITNQAVFNLLHLGRYREAISIGEFGRFERKRLMGEKHPDTLTSMSNLASTYWSMGWHKEALQLEEETLAIRKESLGEKHPKTLASMNNLGNTYWSMGRREEALRLQEETLALTKEALGEKHPQTLTSTSNLANTYWSMGRHEEALRLQEETLALTKEALGEKHPQTLTSMNNLGNTFWSMGWHKEALQLEEETLAISKEALGEKHPDTLTSMNNLASTYWSVGRHEEALSLLNEAIRGSEAVLGHDHPSTVKFRENLRIARGGK